MRRRSALGGASVRRGGAFALAAGLLALLCALQLLSLWRAPAAWLPAVISIDLKPGESITLGRNELAAPQADQHHLGLRRDASGHWFARNVSGARQLLLQRGALERRTGSVALHTGQRFQIGATLFTIDGADAGAVSFSGAGQHWRYGGASLLRDGSVQPPCPDTSIAMRLAAAWNRLAPPALSLARPLVFGGNLYCGNRLGLAHVDPGSATLARAGGQLLLSVSNSGARAPLLLSSLPPSLLSFGAGAHDLARNEEALDGVTALVAGRTRFAVRVDGNSDTLQLRPGSHVALFSEARAVLPPQVQWQWRQRQAWPLTLTLALTPTQGPACWIALGLCCALGLWSALAWQRGRWPFVREVGAGVRVASAGAALLAIAGVGALLLARAGTPPAIGVSILLGCVALWCHLLLPGRLTLVSAAGVLLLALGMLAQLELGLGAMESSWLRHYQKTTALLAIGLGLGACLRLRLQIDGSGAHRARAAMPRVRLEWLLACLACAALALLLLQVVLGDETGVFDLQPVELAKLALTALTAHCMAVGLGRNAGTLERGAPLLRCLRLAAPALLFLALLGLALVEVDDYSPLILLLVWSMAMALAWSIAARQHIAAGAILGLACLGVVAVAWLRNAGAGAGAAEQLLALPWNLYADRFLVWRDPASHPHTGQQLLLAARAIAEGGWWGIDHLLGVSTLGQPAGSALHIPQVQDDFAASFFVHRHGLSGALALWLLQALLLAGLLQTAARCYAAASAARDFRLAWLGRWHCFALCGGAAFVLGHVLLSWGTNLAILPIMGQPMSFLSAGGSHLLFFICPLLILGAISAQSSEEMLSCRSMSNTKC